MDCEVGSFKLPKLMQTSAFVRLLKQLLNYTHSFPLLFLHGETHIPNPATSRKWRRWFKICRSGREAGTQRQLYTLEECCTLINKLFVYLGVGGSQIIASAVALSRPALSQLRSGDKRILCSSETSYSREFWSSMLVEGSVGLRSGD